MITLTKEDAFTIVDIISKAQEIVRCKDCKYFMDGNGCILQGWDYTWEEQMGANDFCSRGERRGEEDE